MGAVHPETAERCHQAQAVLLGYLEAARSWWPGADSLTVQDALRGYPAAESAGLVPGRAELLRTHPELADVLRDLLAVVEAAGRLSQT